MGIMDMLNPVNAAKKVAGGVNKVANKVPGMKQVGSAMGKAAPPGLKKFGGGGIGPSPQSGLMGKVGPSLGGEMMPKNPWGAGNGQTQFPMKEKPMYNGPVDDMGQPIPQMPIQQDMPITPMPDMAMGNGDPRGRFQGLLAAMQAKRQMMPR